MTQEQIEAVREALTTYRTAFGGDVGDLCDRACYALDALTKANKELRAEVERYKRDPQRLIWKDEAAAACPSVDSCFEYGEHVRCGPCGAKLAADAGLEVVSGLPNLPQVSRLNRDLTEARATIERLTRERDEAVARLEAQQEALADQLEARTKAEDQADKFKWQVRDTCSRAEKAEARLAAMQDAVDDTLDRKRRANYACPAETCAAWIVSPLTDFATQPEPDADGLVERIAEMMKECLPETLDDVDQASLLTTAEALIREVRKVGEGKA